MSMTRDQLKHLKARLRAIYIRKRDQACEEPPMPKHVRNSDRIVKSWRAVEQKARYQRTDRLDQANEKAMQAVLFREPQDALAAVQEFERFRP